MNLRSILIIVFTGFIVGGIVSFFLVIEVERAHFAGKLRLMTQCISQDTERGGEIAALEDKIRPSLQDILEVTPKNEAIPVIIQYSGIPSNNCLKDLNERTVKVRKGDMLEERVAFERRFNLINAVAANLTRSMIADILSYDYQILQIESNLDVEIFGERLAQLTQPKPILEHSQADRAKKEFNVAGRGVKIAVIDTGVSSSNEALKGKVVAEKNFTNDKNAEDWIGHGTHAACVIACDSPQYQGVASGSRIYNVKVVGEDGGKISTVIAGLEWAADQWVDIIHLGVGAGMDVCDGTDALSGAVDAAVDAGIVVVAAAGNFGPKEHTLATPGCARKAITVGAVDDNGSIAVFSSRGPTDSLYYTKPDIYGPGALIDDLTYQSKVESISGTSQAASYLTGVIALLKEADKGLDRDDLLNILVETQDELEGEKEGIVNAYEAVEYVGN